MEKDDMLGQIDWNSLGELLQDGSSIDIFHAPDACSCQMKEIESHLMRGDDPAADPQLDDDDIVAQFLLDSPPLVDSSSGADPDLSPSSPSHHGTPDSSDAALAAGADQPRSADEVENAPHDPVLKKRQRQLRNRDAAVRSRERKKMYVKDLESKSKYLEWECRRLGRLLQCCVAENQALRFSLQNGHGATSAKQESAVLLLESLLLGSLLWFLGIICLFPLPTMVPQLWVPLEHKAPPEGEIPRGGGRSKMISILQLGEPSGRRCKASRTRMKQLQYSFPSCISACLDVAL